MATAPIEDPHGTQSANLGGLSQRVNALVSLRSYAAALAMLLALHWSTGDWIPLVTVAVHLLPFIALFAVLLAFVAFGRRLGRAGVELLLVGSIGVLVSTPILPMGHAPLAQAGARTLLFRTWNVGAGRATAGQIADSLLACDADIVCMQELPNDVGRELIPLVADRFPYRAMDSVGRRGRAIFSRWPFLGPTLPQPVANSRARNVQIDFDGTPVLVLNVHPSLMIALLGRWSHHEATLLRAAEEAALHPYAIMAGDLNVSPLAESYRRIRSFKLRNAFDETGHGLGFSFPVFGRYHWIPLPPFVRIDHIWVSSGFGIQSAVLGTASGSDHLPLDALLLLP